MRLDRNELSARRTGRPARVMTQLKSIALALLFRIAAFASAVSPAPAAGSDEQFRAWLTEDP
jgi:hypothetical protein